MKKISKHLTFFLFCELLTFVSLSAFSQTTGYSGTGANIDVNYHRFEWTLDPGAGKTISGTVTTYFETRQNNVSLITFDFTKASFNNVSLVVKYHGSTAGVVVSFPATGNVNILRITLPVTLPVNTLDSVSITYSGTPPNFATYGEGMDLQSIAALGGNTIYTLAESYGDDDFWPCKADMQDKIDSVDFIITTPSAYRAAANGALISDVVSAPNRIMSYKHRCPISSYLVAVAVAQYTVYNRPPVIINGTSVPIVYYIGSGRTPTAGNLTNMDYCRDQLVAFSNVFGDYPFKNEKYGMYEFGWGGGMEHQTFSAMSWGSMTSWSVVAHELAHQWFGDKVTFATWNHLWLAEGFAKYSEVLAAELVPAMGQNPITHRSTIKTTALARSGTPIYLSNTDIANSNVIWTTANDQAVYQRGAMVVSMLRKLAGDTKFFQACRNYLNDPALAYKSATTQMLRDQFEAVVGYDLDAFFTDYIWGTGNPTYVINWGSNGNNINIELTSQGKSAGSTVTYFRTPVVFKISNSGGTKDTTVVIYDQNNILSYAGNGISSPVAGKVLGYNLSFTPATIAFDPDAETLVGASTVTRVTRLNVSPLITLPVDVIDFTLNENNYSNELKLSVSDADGELKKVVVQKSVNGIDFTDAGEMQEKAGSAVLKNFYYADYNVYAVAYYRAKISETNIEKYSKVIKAGGNLTSGVSVYPNPADKEVIIRWAGVTINSGAADVRIFDMDGRQVWSKTTSAGFVTISVAEFTTGTYLVQVSRDKEILLNKKLMIRR